MQGNEICRGARHRILILTYISWLTLSLAPTIVAPPERGFVQGQPEMQQAMDNMVAHGTIVKKRMNTSPNEGLDYHAMLTSKTSNLLEEAEHVLGSLPVSKERQWIEAFVSRMRSIATMLEKTAQNKNQNLPKHLSSVSGTPVPEGLPLQPTWPATSAVPGINPFQKQNRMMSKFPVTSPELSQVLPANGYSSERQAVTKPAVLSSKKEDDEDDELVRELESLHQEFVQPVFQQNSKVLDQVPIFTTPSTPALSKTQSNKLTDLEEEKAKLKAKLIQEIAEFQQLGGVIPNEVIHALYANNQKTTGLPFNQKSNIGDKLKFTEAGMVDEPEIQRLNDFNTEDKEISNSNLQKMEKNMVYHAGKDIQPLNFSHSFQNINPNFHPHFHAFSKVIGHHFPYMYPHSKEPPYEGSENAVHDLQQPNPYNDQEQYHAIVPPTNQQPGHIPDALKQMLSKPQNKIYNEHLASNYNEYLMKHSYGPYPYIHNWDKKNLTHHLSLTMPPYQPKQPVSHKIDTQLSDEMKRQLRDGKIIVLSDSVVRSNFEPDKDENITENKKEKPDKVENKNNTVTAK
jgi:hypothetical protein